MIKSRNNPEIVEIAKLKQKKYRDNTNKFLIEGIKLVEEALTHTNDIEKIYLTHSIRDKVNIPENIEVIEVTEKVLDKLSSQKNPEGIIAVLNKTDKEFKNSEKVLLLDNIQDPGNLGTIIRTADAAGFTTVYCSPDCADLYNEKTIRATMGSVFHIQIKTNQNLEKVINKLNTDYYETIAAVLDGEIVKINKLDKSKKIALLVGNESRGIKQELIELCKKKIALPMVGMAESLNVAIAAGILMYTYIME